MFHQHAGKYVLGEFLLEPDKRLLTRGGEPVHLAHRPFQVLLHLIEHRDRVVSRAELLELFWEGRDVYDDTLRKSVSAIRRAFGDNNGERPRYVETRRGEGYRYVGPFEEQRPAPEPEPRAAAHTPAGPSAPTPPPHPPAVEPRARTARRYKTLTSGLLALALAAATLAAYKWRPAAAGHVNHAPPNSVAVLPLKNLTDDPANDYLSDGITESLINALSKVKGLKVIAWGSVFTLKGRGADPQELGRKLGAAAVLQGGVFRSQDRIRVEVRLVSTEDGRVLWTGAPYDRGLDDIFALQDEIAGEVVAGLEYRLSAEDERRLAGRHTRSVAAYQEYLKGRHQLNKRTAAGIGKAIEYFGRAIELDRDYALAYAALAESYDKYYWLGFAESDPKELLAKQRAAATKALALDDSLAETHIAMGSVYNNEWDLLSSAKELERAIEIDPRNAEARHNYAYRLLDTVRPGEAVTQIKLARELDPLNVVMNVDVAEILLLARRYDEAIAAYRHALEMDPNRANAYEGLAWAYEGKGMSDEAVAAFLQSFALNGRSPDEVAELRRAYESGGMRGYWQKSLEQELRRDYTEPVSVGNIYTKLGDKDRAFAWYEKAYRAHSPSLIGARSSAKVDSLRSDPRYADLVSRIGLP